jgi:hypothetical protein
VDDAVPSVVGLSAEDFGRRVMDDARVQVEA